MRHIHVEIHANDLHGAYGTVDAEQRIYLKLAEKWVFDWTEEAAQ